MRWIWREMVLANLDHVKKGPNIPNKIRFLIIIFLGEEKNVNNQEDSALCICVNTLSLHFAIFFFLYLVHCIQSSSLTHWSSYMISYSYFFHFIGIYIWQGWSLWTPLQIWYYSQYAGNIIMYRKFTEITKCHF